MQSLSRCCIYFSLVVFATVALMLWPPQNGSEAIKLARSCPPDLIPMDLAMPEMVGSTATRRLKDDGILTNIPLIIVTGRVTRQDMALAQEVGCNDVASKPIGFHIPIGQIDQHF